MTFLQLKYMLAIAEYGSVSLAARNLFISQPSLTEALSSLEREIRQTLFVRGPRGVTPTDEGRKFLGFARQVVEQMRLLEDRYSGESGKRYFSVSTQHYTFVASAFVELAKKHSGDDYELSLLEERTGKIIENVRNFKSEIGVLYMSRSNETVLRKLLKESRLVFSPLFMARPHVFLYRKHPLAKRASVGFADLGEFPCVIFDQGEENPFYFAEEVGSERQMKKRVLVTDRAAVANFLMALDAYIVTTGVLPSFLHGRDIVAVPLDVDEPMTVGTVRHADRRLSELGHAFMTSLAETAGKMGLAEVK
ncbi:MAG: LysR family transcriptional regulator [Schwartzia succinivorans]|nr:LysR family transcriptional regulator [Schwartzia succinivorans]